MSKLSSMKARFARLAPAPDASRLRCVFAGPRVPVLLELADPRAFDADRIGFARTLVAHGTSLREAHTILGRLAEFHRAATALSGVDVALGGAFAPFGIRVVRPKTPDVAPAEIRARTGLSQPEFAARYGFSDATIKNWEQGRAKPDAAARIALWLIDNDPDAIDRALGIAAK
jgi:putative transcriptional regulator